METKMTVGEVEKLIFCCKETGKSRSEIVRDGIEKIYTELRTEKLK